MTSIRSAFAAAWSALKFWIANLPAMLRLTWFPLALVGLTGYAWTYWNTGVEIGRATNVAADPFMLPTPQELFAVVVWSVLQLIALSAAAVAVHRLVTANERRPGEFFAFAFGKAELAYFAMGVVAYALAWMLVAGQYVAQLTPPPLDESFVQFVAVSYGALGPWALTLLILPGEVEIFTMPPLNYALWCALVIATGGVLLRIAPWPASIAATQSFALARTLEITRGRTGMTLSYALAIAAALLVVLAAASAVGISSLLYTGPEGLGQLLNSFRETGTEPSSQNLAIQMALQERGIAFAQEIARFVTSLIGGTLGATLVSHLYLLLGGEKPDAHAH